MLQAALLAAGANPDATDADGNTALMWAAGFSENPETVLLLLDAGADVNRQASDGRTALMRAAGFSEQTEIVQLLLDAGADVNRQASDGRTALLWAAGFSENPETVQLLLDAGADVNRQASDGSTALMWAANKGKVDAAKALLAAGADINVEDVDGFTALLIATKSGEAEVERVLLDAGAVQKDMPPAFQNFDEGIALLQSGDLQAALVRLNRAIELKPDFSDAYFARGIAYTLMEDFNAAVEDLSETIRLDPENSKAYLQRGYAYTVMGDFDAALKDFSETIRLDPSNVWVYSYRGGTNARLGHYAAAVEDCNNALNNELFVLSALPASMMQPSYTDLDIALREQDYDPNIIWNFLFDFGPDGDSNADLSPEDFSELFDAVIQKEPDLAPAYLFRGVAHLQLNEMPSAAQDMEDALRLDPSMACTMYYMMIPLNSSSLMDMLTFVDPNSVLGLFINALITQFSPEK